MTCGKCHKFGVLAHVVTFVPFIVGFATTDWARFHDQGSWQYGLWKICFKGNATAYVPSNGRILGVTPNPELECQDEDIHDLPAILHICRTLFCLALVVYGIAFVTKCNWISDSDNDDLIKLNLKVQTVIFIFLLAGSLVFHFHKEDLDKSKSISSTFGASAIAVFVVVGINLLAMFLTASPLIERKCKKFIKRCKSCCKRNENRRHSESSRSTTSATATAQNITSSRIVTATTDISMVEMVRPPSYNECRSENNSWFERYVFRSRENHDNTASNSSNPAARRDSAVIIGLDLSSRRSSNATNGVFTVRVHPAPSSATSPTRPYPQPPSPPPKYEDISDDSTQLQHERSDRTAPPPSYETTIAGSSTAAEGNSSGAHPHPQDNRLLLGFRQLLSPPPAYSDA
ncbi:hypothetical protein PoB_003714500 [Plakobranchus ocellatus]|uniref:Uncharacterized protein n=1 Tax=Plakobranchus ocellatus TaxID=259542 RepID=A0AAV4ATK1_9GAST|nr:hypothetical protein PoB_003714500 [Plakobranchus ocellatus]